MRKVMFFVLLWVTGICGFGQQVKNFSLTDVVSGKVVSLRDYNDARGLVILFVSNTCPYDSYYYSRIKALTSQQHIMPVILVNSLPGENENAEAMKAKIAETGIDAPYLADKAQTLMAALGASKTPQAVVLKNNGSALFTIFYNGAIDDNAQVEADVHSPYVANAISALLHGQKITATSVRPVGCTIRKR